MARKKRYFFNVVEEMVMNSKFEGYRAGRIEIYDRRGETREARFLIPESKETDKMPYICWDCGITEMRCKKGLKVISDVTSRSQNWKRFE